MNGWIAIAVLGAISYALRSVVVLGLGDRPLPPFVVRVTGLLAPAIMGAMVAGSLATGWFGHSAGAAVGAGGTLVRVVAITSGGVVAARTGSVGRALVTGVTLYVVLAELGA